MIEFEEFTLDNGLTVICHQDKQTQIAAVNMLYQVGSRNENPNKTGIAHLFEHLMFGGSLNAPNFDIPIQEAGGDNNAFTNADITNYYNMMPSQNIDIALWLEADRMANLTLNHETLDIQKKVVVEEFYETCLNKPYGDSWHKICALAYQGHTYMWPTIGLTTDHVQSISLEDAHQFYSNYYQPSNSILTIASPYDARVLRKKVEHWFGGISSNPITNPETHENVPTPTTYELTVHQNVPAPHIFFVFPMPGRKDKDYYVYDLLSDVLGYGTSSRLYAKLVKEKHLFTSLNCYINGVEGPGLLIIDGRLAEGVSRSQAKAAIWDQLSLLTEKAVPEVELQKVKNKTLSSMRFSDVSLLNRAINLGYFASLGDVSLMNTEDKKYHAVTTEQILEVSNKIFLESKYFEVFYQPT